MSESAQKRKHSGNGDSGSEEPPTKQSPDKKPSETSHKHHSSGHHHKHSHHDKESHSSHKHSNNKSQESSEHKHSNRHSNNKSHGSSEHKHSNNKSGESSEQKHSNNKSGESSEQKHSNNKSGESSEHKEDPPTAASNSKIGEKVGSTFFDVPADDLAKKLLGQTFVRMTAEGKRLSGRIVETEAFLGEEDKASHCYQGKRSAKNEALYMSPGTLYVYNLMGGKYCMKISSQGDGAGVMLKSLEAIDGEDIMREVRTAKSTSTKPIQTTDLCNGPSKMCQSLQVTRADADKQNLCQSEHFWLEKAEVVPEDTIVSCKRINVDHADEWKDKHLRFYILGDFAVSTRDKEEEQKMKETKTSEKTHKPSTAVFDEDRVDFNFYDVSCTELARKLLGQTIVRITDDGDRLAATIVETEAYLGEEDKGAHSYQNKRTPKNEAMFMPPGTVYVYNIYGVYCCMNISSQGEGCAVLIRALDPIEGEDRMRESRKKAKASAKPISTEDLCNGPSKLCQALELTRGNADKVNLTKSEFLWLEADEELSDSEVVTCKRINIDYADDWKDKPLRFYVLGNSAVSVRDKDAEKQMKA